MVLKTSNVPYIPIYSSCKFDFGQIGSTQSSYFSGLFDFTTSSQCLYFEIFHCMGIMGHKIKQIVGLK